MFTHLAFFLTRSRLYYCIIDNNCHLSDVILDELHELYEYG